MLNDSVIYTAGFLAKCVASIDLSIEIKEISLSMFNLPITGIDIATLPYSPSTS